MSVWLIVILAILTYGSRALAMVAMPDPSPRVRRILDRIPAPLFASLAAISLFDGGELVDERTLAATVGALLAAGTRSLLLVLAGGLVGYAIVALV